MHFGAPVCASRDASWGCVRTAGHLLCSCCAAVVLVVLCPRVHTSDAVHTSTDDIHGAAGSSDGCCCCHIEQSLEQLLHCAVFVWCLWTQHRASLTQCARLVFGLWFGACVCIFPLHRFEKLAVCVPLRVVHCVHCVAGKQPQGMHHGCCFCCNLRVVLD